MKQHDFLLIGIGLALSAGLIYLSNRNASVRRIIG